MHSMTGYGTGRAPLGDGTVLIEARAVNHRYLDVRVRLPTELAEHVHTVDAVTRARLTRGRVDVVGRLESSASGAACLDMPRARAAFRALRDLRDELAPGAHLPLSLLGAVPDLFGAAAGSEPEEVRRALEEATTRACDSLWEMRAREGTALHAEFSRLTTEATAETEVIAERIPSMVKAYRQKLDERISSLLTKQIALDAGRLEHEVTLFADRADVTEEIARLLSHIDQLQRVCGEAGGIGRKLDFLLQEMAREANTIGSKVADADITLHVVELKAVLERMREQVQNVL